MFSIWKDEVIFQWVGRVKCIGSKARECQKIPKATWGQACTVCRWDNRNFQPGIVEVRGNCIYLLISGQEVDQILLSSYIVLYIVFSANHLNKYMWGGKRASLVAQLVKNPPVMQGPRFNSWVRKIPWRRERLPTPVFLGFPCGSAGKESLCNAGDLRSIPWLGRLPWRRERLPTPVFWSGEFHGL